MTKWFNLWKKYRIGLFIFVTVVTAIYIFPIIWTFITSLRPTQDIYRYPPTIIPRAVTPQNYIYVLTQMKGFLRYFLNSVAVTFITAVIVIISSAMGGYAFGMRKFRGQNMLFAAVIAVLMIPYLMYLIPIFIMEDKIGLRNTWWGLVLPYAALNLPWGLLIMRGAFSTIPLDIRDAAVIDGCNEFQFWYRVMLPITRPALAATSIITFVFAWQEYMFVSTLMTKNEWQTLPVGIVWIRDELQTLAYGRVGATIMLSIIPVIILFVVFRNFFIKGLSEGMLKG
ncbi:MAG: carbohydrate ABC transporter permease [Desulfobacteraceae bacterium]|nr:MAG: carbohydrate ABC transporter permease [Desulfobacteraceae bacterium]